MATIPAISIEIKNHYLRGPALLALSTGMVVLLATTMIIAPARTTAVIDDKYHGVINALSYVARPIHDHVGPNLQLGALLLLTIWLFNLCGDYVAATGAGRRSSRNGGKHLRKSNPLPTVVMLSRPDQAKLDRWTSFSAHVGRAFLWMTNLAVIQHIRLGSSEVFLLLRLRAEGGAREQQRAHLACAVTHAIMPIVVSITVGTSKRSLATFGGRLDFVRLAQIHRVLITMLTVSMVISWWLLPGGVDDLSTIESIEMFFIAPSVANFIGHMLYTESVNAALCQTIVITSITAHLAASKSVLTLVMAAASVMGMTAKWRFTHKVRHESTRARAVHTLDRVILEVEVSFPAAITQPAPLKPVQNQIAL